MSRVIICRWCPWINIQQYAGDKISTFAKITDRQPFLNALKLFYIKCAVICGLPRKFHMASPEKRNKSSRYRDLRKILICWFDHQKYSVAILEAAEKASFSQFIGSMTSRKMQCRGWGCTICDMRHILNVRYMRCYLSIMQKRLRLPICCKAVHGARNSWHELL